MVAGVTGASRGIGLAISKKLLNEGYKCIMFARTKTVEVDRLIAEYGDKVKFASADISCKEGRDNIITTINAECGGKIDLFVNNAGVAPKVRMDILELTEEDYDYVLNINLKGTFFVTQQVAKLMAKNKCGRIINISSISSYTASTERAAYCVSKAGISMITKLYATRLASDGIGVFEISPGIIESDMTSVVKDKYEKLIADGLTLVPRMGVGDDIANCVLAISEGRLDFCTGTVLNADGGFSIRRL